MRTVVQSEPVAVSTVVQKVKFRTFKSLILPAGLHGWGKI